MPVITLFVTLTPSRLTDTVNAVEGPPIESRSAPRRSSRPKAPIPDLEPPPPAVLRAWFWIAPAHEGCCVRACVC